jgi:hypothetical protein
MFWPIGMISKISGKCDSFKLFGTLLMMNLIQDDLFTIHSTYFRLQLLRTIPRDILFDVERQLSWNHHSNVEMFGRETANERNNHQFDQIHSDELNKL